MTGKMTGGERIAEVLVDRGVEHLFTLCGGHISPILVAAKKRGIRVIDMRHEASAAFAADAVARLTGRPGIVAVTAGPGVTNTITAIKNAQLAQSPVVLLGGATGTILKGRGSLQDIDQMALFEPHVKWMGSVEKVRELIPALEEAFDAARLGVPGPAFVECPVDLLYEESLVRKLYGVGDDAPAPRTLAEKGMRWYLNRHLSQIFSRAEKPQPVTPLRAIGPVDAGDKALRAVAGELRKAERPLLVVGSQALLARPGEALETADATAAAVAKLGVPTYLSGMARGLLGADHALLRRHKRRNALKEADLVLLFGVPQDFRLDYGRYIRAKTRVVAVNLSQDDLIKNRKPTRGELADPGHFLRRLAEIFDDADAPRRWTPWLDALAERDAAREAEIDEQAAAETEFVNPLHLCREIDKALDDDSVLVTDGGDFVGTASYTVRPRGPLRWLDPGVFGTLGVGGGFATGAKAVRPDSEVWLLWGDGSAAYSLAEFDTWVRHGMAIIAVVGNDASWMQIAREQVEILGDACGTELLRTDYHIVAEGYGGRGLKLERREDVAAVLAEAKEIARSGKPVLINVMLGRTDFRKGSLSM